MVYSIYRLQVGFVSFLFYSLFFWFLLSFFHSFYVKQRMLFYSYICWAHCGGGEEYRDLLPSWLFFHRGSVKSGNTATKLPRKVTLLLVIGTKICFFFLVNRACKSVFLFSLYVLCDEVKSQFSGQKGIRRQRSHSHRVSLSPVFSSTRRLSSLSIYFSAVLRGTGGNFSFPLCARDFVRGVRAGNWRLLERRS